MIRIKEKKDSSVKLKVVVGDKVGVRVPEVQTIIKDTYDHYKGDYTVIPDVEAVVLPTRDKLMDDNITVFKIPLWEVSNTSGGSTIYIGGEEIYGN